MCIKGLTIFSRVNVGCETTMNALIFACITNWIWSYLLLHN